MKYLLTHPIRLAETVFCVFITILFSKILIDAGLIHLSFGAKMAIGIILVIVFIPILKKVLQ